MTVYELDDDVSVAGQIRPEDLPALAARGIAMIVNNRPDGEEPGQPSGDEIEEAARAAGLQYREIPIGGGIDPEQIVSLCAVMEDADGPMLMYCRSAPARHIYGPSPRRRQGGRATRSSPAQGKRVTISRGSGRVTRALPLFVMRTRSGTHEHGSRDPSPTVFMDPGSSPG